MPFKQEMKTKLLLPSVRCLFHIVCSYAFHGGQNACLIQMPGVNKDNDFHKAEGKSNATYGIAIPIVCPEMFNIFQPL